ncbi:AAA family ATPase [Mesorhizobium sp. MSK_1335]|uniref:AAA family ATPase n=1 Tax=Mesorhizobium montanum TaxID=3072323 RepID=A0ABU4ZE89_9HYPH|nr:AAA family ATPase [Mesorhizobium sp. MSK_1335]MDX8523686.1 AAA family ATPase [Mesorhizobium sp. MSK_1335]
MIVELFGPPGSGKTTFAHALASRLREDGYRAEVVRSYRPTTKSGTLDLGVFLFVARIVSATVSTAKIIFFPRNGGSNLSKSLLMLRAIPPKKPIWRARIWQHILKLSHAWDRAKLAQDILIFDEGYVQAIGSLALLNGNADKAILETMLSNVPVADFTIRVVVPRAMVAARLRRRMEREPPAERLFEADFEVNMRSLSVFKTISDILAVSGRDVICAKTSSQRSTVKSTQDVEQAIIARYILDKTDGERRRGDQSSQTLGLYGP